MSGIDLVTGATGLLGANLVRSLLTSGRRVRILIRPTSPTRHLEDLSEVERCVGDVTVPETLRAASAGVERIYHCAAVVSMWSKRAQAMWDVNVQGTENVISAAREAGVQRLIHCSSVDAIGLPEGDAPSDEETPWNWDRLGVENAYARTKYEAQRRALAANAEGLDVVVVNPAYMFGAYDVRPTSGRMILEVHAGKTVGYTRGGNNFVHVKDVADAMLAVAERGRRGELYILGNADMTYREVFTLIADVLGASPPRFAIPYPLARLGGWSGDVLSWFARNEPAVTSVTAKLGYVNHYYSPRKAVEELGMRQTPVREAVECAVAWFREVGMLPA